MPIKNAFTVDLEEWFHISGVPSLQDMKRWDDFESRIEDNTHRLLKILDDHDVKATFFVLGWIAEKYPRLVKQIHDAGHEIGNHGYRHRSVHSMSSEEFEEDLMNSTRVIEGIIDEKITAFRAPSFSVNSSCTWSFEILAENGYKIDSSIVKGKRDCGGIQNTRLAKNHIFDVETKKGNIVEFPLRKEMFLGFKVPVTGGGYLRALPMWLIDHTIKKANKKNVPIFTYIHPSDLDKDRPILDDLNFTKRFRAKVGLRTTERKVRYLLSKFDFGTISQVIEEIDVNDSESLQ